LLVHELPGQNAISPERAPASLRLAPTADVPAPYGGIDFHRTFYHLSVGFPIPDPHPAMFLSRLPGVALVEGSEAGRRHGPERLAGALPEIPHDECRYDDQKTDPDDLA
jgi:hypothetical protein